MNLEDIYDLANDECAQAKDWALKCEEEREMMLEEALDEALDKGVSIDSLRTLARETGATHWALSRSLKN